MVLLEIIMEIQVLQGILVKSELVLQILNFMLIQKVKTLSINMMGKQILRLLKNNKLVVVFLYFTFIVYSCKNNKERERRISKEGCDEHQGNEFLLSDCRRPCDTVCHYACMERAVRCSTHAQH